MWNQGLCWSADSVTVHPGTWVRRVWERSQEVFICHRQSLSELFDDISLVLNVRGLCVVVDRSYQCTRSVWLCDFLMMLTLDRQNIVRRRHRFETSRSQIADETSARVRAALLDYKKAFDLVDHNLLTAKLYNLGVRLTVVNWVADFLRDRYQRVELNFDCFSDFKPVPAGIPKGTPDWPTALFGYDQWPHNE